MANIRVNANNGRGFATSQNGTSGNEYQGVYGIQKAFDVATSGDTVWIYSSSDVRLDTLVNITTSVDKSSTWQIGDLVRNDKGDGNKWTGVICEIVTTSLRVELTSGYYVNVDYTDGVENITRSDTSTATAKSVLGLTIDTNDGVLTDRITVIGCTSAYDSPKLLVLNGNDVVSRCLSISATDYWTLKYLHFYQSFGEGMRTQGTLNAYFQIEHCKSSDNGGIGFDLGLADFAVCKYCVAHNNGNYGFNLVNCMMMFCRATNNANHGIFISNRSICYGSIFANNTRCGVYINAGQTSRIINCVIHGSATGYSGIYIATTMVLILGCRITKNATYGIISNASPPPNYQIEDYNYFQDNTSGNLSNIIAGSSSISGSDVNYGYTDYVNGDFSLAETATLRNTEINLNWDL